MGFSTMTCLAALKGGDGAVGVEAAGGAEADDVDVLVGEEVALVGVDLWDGELVGQGLGAVGQHVGDGDELGVVDLTNGGGVGGADGSAADDAETDLAVVVGVLGQAAPFWGGMDSGFEGLGEGDSLKSEIRNSKSEWMMKSEGRGELNISE
jgi:hypothetical protein